MSGRPSLPPADVVEVLDAVVQAALEGLSAAVAVSVTLVNDFGARTIAASSSWADALDDAQNVAGSGPCVDSAVTGEAFAMVDAASELRWPAYVEQALARGVRSSLSIPIPVDADGVVGSLNAFAVSADGFTDGDERAMTRLAGTAAAALLTADIESYVGRSRAVIDQARGIVMREHACSADRALGILRLDAEDSGRSLRQTATELVRQTVGET